jgi:hypothetical protein
MDANGRPMVLLDGNESFDEEIRARYRLYPDQVAGYRNFYKIMYGIPMSITPGLIKQFDAVETKDFEGQKALAVSFEWKDPVIKPHWTLYVDPITYGILGVDMTDRSGQGDGERIVFRGLVKYGDLQLPHMRHWYDLQEVSYLGSDIIISASEM